MAHVRSFPSPMMRAPDNVTYLQMIEAIKKMWASAAPDIPLESAGNKFPAHYPSIICSLELRTDQEDVGRPTFIEDIEDSHGNQFRQTRMAFKNVVNFTVYHDSDPDVADLAMERFELFFIEAIPLLERLGVKDVRYARRNEDNQGARSETGVITRSLSVLATTEYVISTPVTRLNAITIEARVDFNPHSVIIPHEGVEGSSVSYKPRYYKYGGANPIFQVAEDELEYIYIPMTNFQPDDVLYLAPIYGYEFIGQFAPFYIQIVGLENEPYLFETRYRVMPFDINTQQTYGGAETDSTEYETDSALILTDSGGEEWMFKQPGKGQAFFVSPSAVDVNIRE